MHRKHISVRKLLVLKLLLYLHLLQTCSGHDNIVYSEMSLQVVLFHQCSVCDAFTLLNTSPTTGIYIPTKYIAGVI